MARSCITGFFWANTFKVVVVSGRHSFPASFACPRTHTLVLNSLQQIDHPPPSFSNVASRTRHRERKKRNNVIAKRVKFSIFFDRWKGPVQKRDGDRVLRVTKKRSLAHLPLPLSLSPSLVIIPDGTLHNTAVSVNSRVMRRRRGPA